MRTTIRKFIKSDHNIDICVLDCLSTEFAKKLLSCARKGNAELLSVFAASFDANYSDDASMEGGNINKGFDKHFFLENALDIVNSQSTPQ